MVQEAVALFAIARESATLTQRRRCRCMLVEHGEIERRVAVGVDRVHGRRAPLRQVGAHVSVSRLCRHVKQRATPGCVGGLRRGACIEQQRGAAPVVLGECRLERRHGGDGAARLRATRHREPVDGTREGRREQGMKQLLGARGECGG